MVQMKTWTFFFFHRCSAAFFEEERAALNKKRAKIRLLQQRKLSDITHDDLPDEIPMHLVIGTKVTGIAYILQLLLVCLL